MQQCLVWSSMLVTLTYVTTDHYQQTTPVLVLHAYLNPVPLSECQSGLVQPIDQNDLP